MPTFTQDVQEIRRRASQKIEEGAVTHGYKGDVHRTIEILNEALATEIVCVLRYLHHYFMATGVHAMAVRDEFKEHADNEREHADRIAERIQQLGGKPDFSPQTLLQRSASQYVEGETLADMIREDLIAERMVVEIYSDMVRFFGSDDPTTRHMLEEILAEEEEHASDLSDLLYIVEPSTGKTEGEDPGADPLRISGGKREGQNREAQNRDRQNREGQNNLQGNGRASADQESGNVKSNRKQESSGSTSRGNDAKTRQSTQSNRKQERSGAGGRAEAKAEPGTVIGELQRRDREPGVPQSAGRGQRNRGVAGPADAEGGELHSGQQLGGSRAPRQTQPKGNKRKVA